MSFYVSNIGTDKKFYFTWDLLLGFVMFKITSDIFHPNIREPRLPGQAEVNKFHWFTIHNLDLICLSNILLTNNKNCICNVIFKGFITELTCCNRFWYDTVFLKCKHSWEKKAISNHFDAWLLQSPNLYRGADSHKCS